MLTRKLPNAAGTLITVTTVATSLQSLIETAASEAFSLAGLDAIDLRPDGDIRFLADGNTPTSTEGLLLDTFTSLRGIDLSKMQLISPLGSVTVEIQVGKALQGETDFVEGSSGGGGTPGGSDTELQYNNAGSFGGISGITSDGTTLRTNNGIQLLGRDFADANWLPLLELNDFDQIILGDNADNHFLLDTAQNVIGATLTDGSGNAQFQFGIADLSFTGNDNLGNIFGVQADATEFRVTLLENFTDGVELSLKPLDGKIEMQNATTEANLEWSATTGIARWKYKSGTATGAVFDLYFDADVPAANDVWGINFSAKDSAGNDNVYGSVINTIISPTSGAEVGRTGIYSSVNGVNTLGGYAQNGQWNVPAGTLSAPGLAWVTGGSSAGIRAAGVNDIRYVLAGTDRWGYISNQMRQYALGSAGLPSIVSAADPDTGMWVANGVVGFALNGVELARFATGGFIMNNRLQLEQGASIASANDITLGDGNDFEITGAVTINRIATANWQAGSVVTLELPSGITLADGVAAGGGFASIRVSNTGNLTTLGVTVVQLRYNGTTWDVLTINRLT